MFNESMDPWYHGSMNLWIWILGTMDLMDPWYHGSHGSMESWIHRSTNPWIPGSMNPWIHGLQESMDPWIHGTMNPWSHGSMVPWIHGSMASSSLKHFLLQKRRAGLHHRPALKFGAGRADMAGLLRAHYGVFTVPDPHFHWILCIPFGVTEGFLVSFLQNRLDTLSADSGIRLSLVKDFLKVTQRSL